MTNIFQEKSVWLHMALFGHYPSTTSIEYLHFVRHHVGGEDREQSSYYYY